MRCSIKQLTKHLAYHRTGDAWSYFLPLCQQIPRWMGQETTAGESTQINADLELALFCTPPWCP